PFREMLRSLGATGVREARPIIGAHLSARDAELRQAAQDALRLWLVRNGLLGEDATLSGPPYPDDHTVALSAHAPANYARSELTGLPPPPMSPRVPEPTLERRSNAARAGAVVALATGGAAVVVGLYALAAVYLHNFGCETCKPDTDAE